MMIDDKMLEKEPDWAQLPQSRLRLMQFRRALGLLPLALLFVAWELAVEFKVYPTILLPPPAKVAMVFVEDWETVLSNAGPASRASSPASRCRSCSPCRSG